MITESYEPLDEDLVEEPVDVDFDSLLEKDGSGLTKSQIEEWTDQLLRADANRELCRKCKESPEVGGLPYGEDTGKIYPMPQFSKEGEPVLDDDGSQLIVDYPELRCAKGHRWFLGEGARRDIRGQHPILFESHLHNRRRREIYTSVGTPDPSIVSGIYNRVHPNGRKVNSAEQRKKNGAAFYRAYFLLPMIYVILHAWTLHF